MYILRVVIFSLDEPNLTRTLTVFKENLVKYKGKRTSQRIYIYFVPDTNYHGARYFSQFPQPFMGKLIVSLFSIIVDACHRLFHRWLFYVRY